MAPKVLVLDGKEAVERAFNLINGMVERPNNLDTFGRTMVDLMAFPDASIDQMADILQPLVQAHRLEGDDPGFDQRIMYEAVTYAAKKLRAVLLEQVPDLTPQDYRFQRWLGRDLVLELRGSL